MAHTYHDAGVFTIVLEVFDNYAISTKASKRIKIHHVHPPINIQYNFKINRNLFTKECLYEITWEQNPLNQAHGVHVVLYRLLRKEKGSAQFDNVIAEVKSDTFVYLDRRLNESDENRYEYTVTAVDSLGNESVIGGLYLHNFPGNTKKEKTSKKIELKR